MSSIVRRIEREIGIPGLDRIHAGEWVERADGGELDWGRRLVNGEERMAISGVGSVNAVALHRDLEV